MNGVGRKDYWESLFLSKLPLPQKEIKDWIKEYAAPYKELMAYYSCAMMEIEMKFPVLKEELSLQYDRNPIETIKTRLKSVDSIADKLMKRNLSLTVDNIERHIHDVAGVRVICRLSSDIYKVAEAFLRQDGITLLEKRDYVQKPKPSGYRSLHLIVEIPVFLHGEKRQIKVEIQFCTMSMDWWASLEHKIQYKKDVIVPKDIANELRECAEALAILDNRMERIKKKVGRSRGQGRTGI